MQSMATVGPHTFTHVQMYKRVGATFTVSFFDSLYPFIANGAMCIRPYCTGNGARACTTAPVKVEPVVPVNSTW
jgi:hypothetical protein